MASDNNYVTHNDLKQVLDDLVKKVFDGMEQMDDARLSALTIFRDVVIRELENLEYRRMRDVHFFMNIISSIGYGPIEHLEDYYKTYCEEFDKVNKPDTIQN